jgi:hypothetical protein
MLLRIVYFDSSEYSEDAIRIAKEVLSERRLSRPSEELLQKVKLLEVSGFDRLEDEVFKHCFLCNSSVETREMPYNFLVGEIFNRGIDSNINRNLKNLLVVCQSCKPYILTYHAQKVFTHRDDREVVIDTKDKKNLIQYVLREYIRTNKPVLLNVEVIREVTGKKMGHTKYK